MYSALTYKIVDWNRLTGDDIYSKTKLYFFPNNFKTIDALWYMEADEIEKLFEELGNSRGFYYIPGLYQRYFFTIKGKGVNEYLLTKVDKYDIAREFLQTSGLSTRAEYYAGLGVRYWDLEPNHLKSIYYKFLRLNPEAAVEFYKMVILMKTLGATEFIDTLYRFARNDFKTEGLFIADNNVVSDSATHTGMAIGFFAALGNNQSIDDQVRLSNNMKYSFFSDISDSLSKIAPELFEKHLKEFRKIMKRYPEIKNIIRTNICSGLTYSEGALSYVITIYIIKVFSESISLGIFTSIFSIISIITGFLFVKVIKPKYYMKLLCITLPITVLLLGIMLLNCNFVTVVLYNLIHTISKLLYDLIKERNIFNFSNIEVIKNKYKVEYFLTIETSLFIGRVISNTLFIFMAFLNAKFIMSIFVIFVILRSIAIIKLQYDMNKCDSFK